MHLPRRSPTVGVRFGGVINQNRFAISCREEKQLHLLHGPLRLINEPLDSAIGLMPFSYGPGIVISQKLRLL